MIVIFLPVACAHIIEAYYHAAGERRSIVNVILDDNMGLTRDCSRKLFLHYSRRAQPSYLNRPGCNVLIPEKSRL
jgi:hypothetical protein